MDGGFPFFDIVLFAMIAAFLVLRLRNVLGRRTGRERSPNDVTRAREMDETSSDNVVSLPDHSKVEEEVGEETPLNATLRQIAASMNGFDPDEFVAGARMAFEMIVTAYANGDRDTLRPLTSGEVFANFEGAVQEREDKDQTFDSTLVGIRSAEIIDAELDGRDAQVTIKFVSEQINVLRDAEGEILSGGTNAVEEVTDIWSFHRDVRARNPNWVLVATRSEN